MGEERLLKEIRQDPRQFEKVYDQHYNTIFNYTYRRTGDFDTAKDITSEVFLKAYLNINSFRWKGIAIISWLYRIACNEVNLFYRSKKYRPSYLREVISTSIVQVTVNMDIEKEQADEELQKHQQFIRVQKAIKNLPMKCQEVITLKHFERLKIKEISAILDKKEGTVKSLISRGIARLKSEL